MTADNGSGPFYPTLLIHPTADPNTGLRQQYIVFLQRDGTVSKRKERVGLVRRNMNSTFGWFDAQFIQPAAMALPPDASQWSNDGNEWDNIGPDEMRFSRPTAALRTDGSAIGIAFLRLSYIANTSGELVNTGFISQQIRHFHAEYDTNATAWGPTGNVTSPSMPTFRASSITEGLVLGSEDRQFTALPYDPIVPLLGDTVDRWQIAIATNRALDSNNVAINWRYGTVTVKNIDSYGEWREATVFASPAQPLLTSVFPSFVSYRLAAPASTPTYTLAFMGQLAETNPVNLHALTTTQGAAFMWPSADTLTNTSSPAVGAVPWRPGSANGSTDFAWTGHWAGKPNLHYFGTFTGLVAAEGNLFFAWTDSRRFDFADHTKHHESIFGTRFANP
jgi:hypothetical protein